jgi:hypothetical protein
MSELLPTGALAKRQGWGAAFLALAVLNNGDNRRGPTFVLHPGAAAPAQAGSGVGVPSCLLTGEIRAQLGNDLVTNWRRSLIAAT